MCDPCCSPCDPCYPCYPCVPARGCKSRELRGGLLIANCECLKRNGLQHDCPRSECQGKSCCLTKPEATCCPSTYARRFRNVTMGNKSNPVCPKRCRVSTVGSGCNPCGIDCFSCPPPCDCGPCGAPTPNCMPCYDPCTPSIPPPCGDLCPPYAACGPC
ncbi:keratin-associated protein 5-5-like isoform X3 [Ochlerotatus camptorhynchus]|uniref:keratin-associated protein 5-5-like isoform X3 n=1 Tax=Ochlerotatus camptorhynchus TaxID=644619 RepID=UPI0031D6D38F